MVPVRSPLKLVSSMATNARGHVTDGWAGVVEEVIQHTVEARLDRDGRRDNPPEVFAFIQAIDQLIGDRSKRARKEGGGIEASRELEWFAQPCEHMFVFRLSRRQYVSGAYRPDVDRPRGAEDDRETAVDVATRLNKGIGLVPPEAIPSSRELIATLLAHVASGGPHVVRKDSSEQQSFPELPLHSARRSAILNWQRRLEDLYRRRFAHEEGIAPEYAFPYVGIEIFDGEYLALVLVAPMDENFIDDKVPADSRACEIGLAFYRLERQVDPDALQAATALLREGFAHALFHLRTEQNRNVVVGSFGEVAKITRHWYQNASLYSILGDEASRDRFDPVRFCEALVHKLLCSVEGVNEREVYPFDRVYIFREAGTTTELTREPIEMWVLEASIKSEDPDDLGAYLTRRERTTRDTAEYRCRKSQKMIEAKNTHRFFLQCSSHERAADRLFLSKSASVTDVEMENAELQSNSRSMGSKAIDLSDHEVYRIDVGEDDDEKTLSMALYNLLAGKITRARTKEREQGMRVEVQEADALSDDFWEDTRLAVNQRADQHGLYFEYEHGLDLSVDVPLLDRLQKAYFRFLKDRARLDDDEYEKLTLRKSNFAPKQIEDIRARRRSEKREAARDASQTESGNSKVVYISFSSELHDENNRLVLEEQRASRRDKHRNNDSAEAEVPPILGPEYAFTMVFVSDNEPEKTRPDLQREKEDLRTVISMIIRQVWADKLKERRYLERRSKSIGECLSGFLHRAKGYIKDPRQKAEVDALHNGLQKLIAPERGHAEWQSFTSAEQVLWRMMTGESIEGVTEAAVGERLQSMAHDSVGEGAVRLAGGG